MDQRAEGKFPLLPLDGSGWLAGHIIDDAVDPLTELMIRVKVRARSSWGSRDQSAVMKSSVSTARTAITFS